MYVAIGMTLVGLVWFVLAQRRPPRPVSVLPASAAGSADEQPGQPEDAQPGAQAEGGLSDSAQADSAQADSAQAHDHQAGEDSEMPGPVATARFEE
jgi:hypothetical protein